MSVIDRDTVRKVAFLSRIKVEEEALDGLAGEISKILTWIEKLQEVDVSNVEPLASVVELTQPMRQDKITDGGYPEKVLSNAPKVAHGYFTVPKVVE